MSKYGIFWFRSLFAFFTILFFVSISSCAKKQASQNPEWTISVADDDIEMKAAFAKARATLPKFWNSFEHPINGEQDFSLKKEIVDRNGSEYFWFTDIRRSNKKIFGLIGNEPERVKNVKYGQEIEIKEQEISDWTYMKKGKMYGNYTLRVLFKQMSTEEANTYKKILAEP